VTSALSPLDRLGTPIVPGVFILYAHALGRSAALQWARVLLVEARADDPYGAPHGVSILTWGVADRYEGPELQRRPGRLLFPDRIVVVPRRRVPKAERALLTSPTVRELLARRGVS